ncbi:hypothetical protein B5C34_04250 [Pacificimonas flava]|uniref:Glutathione S-transferase n=2 Tax=Pacificimonas TaxID=1960290 RepID=A0A219B4L8_9SPHN|nr:MULTISPECIES: glutathione S-transferase family protein [Pacificimonas]MBZ6377569.1 glutathione S-transferase family protein [Pacificimonas aurantium]OWV32739.1 hypothetical protein B5C34_04250 [Pacificimonas flava]
MITLYWSPQTRSARAFWMLEEVGRPYRLEAVDIRAETRRDPKGFAEASPLGKVPALTDGETSVADSAAIALYLADRYAAGDLAPLADDPARGEFLYWLFYTPSVIEPAMAEKIAGIAPNPVSFPWGSFDKMVAALERRLADREWVSAGRFTMADLLLAGSVDFLASFGMLQPSKPLADYRDRCLARPAAVRAREREASAAAGA